MHVQEASALYAESASIRVQQALKHMTLLNEL